MYIFLKLLLVQTGVFIVIGCCLWETLKKELTAEAIRQLQQIPSHVKATEIHIVNAFPFSSAQLGALNNILSSRFSSVVPCISFDRRLWAGMYIRVDNIIIDMTLLSRMKYFMGQGHD
jgi:F0F1-type ATP synthase delta subunit